MKPPPMLKLSVRTARGATNKQIDIEQLATLDRMLKAAERECSFRVLPRYRVQYLAHLYNCALYGSFRTQQELNQFMLALLRERAGTH